MNERLIYSWDDDEGRHTVCSECLKTFGQIAGCAIDANSKDFVCEFCAHSAGSDKDEE